MTRVCVPLSPASTAECCEKIRRLASNCDLFEIRADAFTEEPDLDVIFRAAERPLIWTHRNTAEGGKNNPRQNRRLAEYRSALQRGASLVDVEWRSGLAQELDAGERTVLSFHDFEKTPVDILSIVRQMAAMPRAIIKVATRVQQTRDMLALVQGARWLLQQNRRHVVFGMGLDGKPLRLLAPQLGAEWSYAALDKPTADGQLTGEDLSQYRFGKLGKTTRVFAVIGNPIGHSLSPSFHNAAYSSLGLDAVYVSIRVDDLSCYLRLASELNIAGWSVTIPWKSEMAQACRLQDAASRESGAVNTVMPDGRRLLGWNTDWHGFLQPLRTRLALKDAGVTVIGAGGAARSAVAALRSEGARVTVLARRAEALAQFERDFSVKTRLLNEASGVAGDLIVNATPVGMAPLENKSPIPASCLQNFRIAYDLVYNPRKTLFLCKAAEMGLQTISGWEMFVHQAAEQVRIFTGQHLSDDWQESQLHG
ncbi:MAG TPA: type I 3-dehydroquinate dehydratase [Acidobacteriota bacterium]|jgi:3-dehydroquinate dehydratase/shikimate dehydrogenase